MSDAGSDWTLSTFTAADGENIAVHEWPLDDGAKPRAVVLLVHGLGEHAGRYHRLAQALNEAGFLVRGYDQYGHGLSDGVRGGLPHAHRMLEDLADLVESLRHLHPQLPLVLFGHSLGGLVAAGFVARGILPVDALVLSSPALATRLSLWQKLLLAIVARLLPNLAVRNGIDPKDLSHDPEVVAAYRADPLVHDRITGRLARFIASEAIMVQRCAPRWLVPTLLLYAGQDLRVDPGGSRGFARAAPRGLVRARRFDGLYHEIFNEQEAQPVYAALRQWLDARF
jgi:alpha-beta hydrolase superfamily lysophospholipase